MHLGYERVGVERSVVGEDVAHGYLWRRGGPELALCGSELGTTFDLLLFGTASPTMPHGVEKCVDCLRIAREAGAE